MDFLTTAFYIPKEDEGAEFVGALVTHFNEDNDTVRARVKYLDVKTLKDKSNGINPRGFLFDENGVLLSDTSCRQDISPDMRELLASQVTVEADKDLIDLVLLGVDAGAEILVNPSDADGDVIGIPFSNLKVSNSSFNIYSAYQRKDGGFRTFSLVDIESGEAMPFNFIVPVERADFIQDFGNLVHPLVLERPVEGYKAFASRVPLVGFRTYTGEAFCNFLAYSVAFYRIGLEVMDSFLADTKYIPKESPEPQKDYVRKVPKWNVSIESEFKHAKLDAVLSCINDPQRMSKLVAADHEANITLTWVQHIKYESFNYDAESVSEKMALACAVLKPWCKRSLLRYSLELLSQRVYISTFRPLANMYGPVLKGGGVSGCSIKRSTW